MRRCNIIFCQVNNQLHNFNFGKLKFLKIFHTFVQVHEGVYAHPQTQIQIYNGTAANALCSNSIVNMYVRIDVCVLLIIQYWPRVGWPSSCHAPRPLPPTISPFRTYTNSFAQLPAIVLSFYSRSHCVFTYLCLYCHKRYISVTLSVCVCVYLVCIDSLTQPSDGFVHRVYFLNNNIHTHTHTQTNTNKIALK